MNRFILAIAVAIALVGTVYAGNLYRPVLSTSHSLAVEAGEIAADGSIERGSGFTVRHLRRGVYAILFDPDVFSTGCVALTATPNSFPLVPISYQIRCRGQVVVLLYAEGAFQNEDEEFHFTAIEEK